MKKRLLSVLLATAMLITPNFAVEAKTTAVLNPGDGNLHTLAVQGDKTLWGWGLNRYGELGLGSTQNQLEPQKITGDVIAVSTGARHSLVLKADGTVYAAGANDFGQLGTGNNSNALTLAKVLTGVVEIAAGETTSFAVKSDGTLWAWGDNQYGMLGDTTTQLKSSPVKILDSVAHVYPGSFHTMALKKDGTLWVWGQNLDDQMGTGSLGQNLSNYSASPILLMDHVKSAAAGGKHSLVIKTDGTLWAFGDNYEGELGNGTTEDSPTPIQVGSGFEQIAAGYEFSAGIKSDGTLWTWGGNTFGQLGDGSFDYRTSPKQIMTDVVTVAAAPYGLRVLKKDGTLWACGTNAYGEVGNGTTGDVSTPVKVMSGVAIPSANAGTTTSNIESGQAGGPSAWAQDSVNDAVQLGIVPETLQSQYTSNITREEFCSLLAGVLETRTGLTMDKILELAGCTIDTSKFTDTKNETILKINALGLVNGKGNGKFDPKGLITRQEAAAMLYRLGDLLGRTIVPESKNYSDSSKISAWAKDAVNFISSAYDSKSGSTIMKGVSGNRFDPSGYFTREQAILTVLRAHGAQGFGNTVQKVAETVEVTSPEQGELLTLANGTASHTILAAKLKDYQSRLGVTGAYRAKWDALYDNQETELASQLKLEKPEEGYPDYAAFLEAYIDNLDEQYALHELIRSSLDTNFADYHCSSVLEQYADVYTPLMEASIRGTSQTGEYADLTRNEKEALAFYISCTIVADRIPGSNQLEQCFVYALEKVKTSACLGDFSGDWDFADLESFTENDQYAVLIYKETVPDNFSMVDSAVYFLPGAVFTIRDGETVDVESAYFYGKGILNVENGARWNIVDDRGTISFEGGLTLNDQAQITPVATRYYNADGEDYVYSLNPEATIRGAGSNSSARKIVISLYTEYHWVDQVSLPESVTVVVGSHRTLTFDSLYSILESPIIGEQSARLIIKQMPGGSGLYERTNFYDKTGKKSVPYEGKTYVWSINPDGGTDTDTDDGWLMQ